MPPWFGNELFRDIVDESEKMVDHLPVLLPLRGVYFPGLVVYGSVPGIPKGLRNLVGAGAQLAVLVSLLQTIGQPSLSIPRLLQETFQGYPEKGSGSSGRGGEYPPGLFVKLANLRGISS